MKKFQINAQQKAWILTAGAAGLVLWLGWGIFIRKDMGVLKKLQQEMKTEIKKKEVQTHIEFLQKEIRDYGREYAKNTDIGSLVEAVGGMARESRVTLTSVSPRDPIAVKFGDQVSLEISGRAGYHAIGHFVSLLESHPERVDVTHLQIRKSSREPGKQQALEVMATISISSFGENKAGLGP